MCAGEAVIFNKVVSELLGESVLERGERVTHTGGCGHTIPGRGESKGRRALRQEKTDSFKKTCSI